MSITVAPVPIGSIIADSDTIITTSVAAELKQAGVHGVARYLSRTAPQHGGDLSAAEVTIILSAGLGLMCVQHFGAARKWWPNAALGNARATAAVANAQACGILPGVSIAVDVESPASDVTWDEIWAFENAWTSIVRTAGYQSILYLAQAVPAGFSAESLFIKVMADRYWGSDTNLAPPAHRGWCMKQSLPKRLAGIAVDLNVASGDSLGGLPTWMVAA